MKRKRVVRLQLLALAAIAVLVFWRFTRGPGTPPGLVTISDLDEGEVVVRTFELETGSTVAIHAVGSVEDEDGQVPAAYGWILRRDSREVVWTQDLSDGLRERTRVTTSDSVWMEPGTYEAYFTSFGATERSRSGRGALGLKAHWTNDQKFWQMVITPTNGAGQVVRLELDAWDDDAVWSTGAVGNRKTVSTRLRVEEPTEVRIYAVAELCVRDCDTATITPLGEDEPVWQMTRENTSEAGGLLRNRKFDGPVALQPGIYEAVFTTDGSHAARGWRANPPFDPIAWGMRLWGNPEQVREFDPWTGPEPIVSFREVGNDADLEAVLEVSEPVRLVVVSTGEVGSGDTVYDYAWLEAEGVDRVWEQTVDNSESAGGDRTNRVETAFLDLESGTYTLRYVTDGSHAFGDWRRREPAFPERWGVSVFPLEAADGDRVQVISSGSREAPVVAVSDDPGETMGAPPDESQILFNATRLGNEQQRTGAFSFEKKTRVRIIGLGELSDGGRYDYGWIESSEGATVWEMTRRNTRPAGGNDINRIYDGILELDPGSYVIGFKTDFSHSYGDFGGGAPRNPEAWGIRVYNLDR
ncbi:MAG: hypothetical protein JJ896_17110 [Rhodothermales bacterium]|nr:hypothetical protein [Rhodothermales bacterium]MBO6781380.1 hypothetical protein [Rhodothermales bacterium]